MSARVKVVAVLALILAAQFAFQIWELRAENRRLGEEIARFKLEEQQLPVYMIAHEMETTGIWTVKSVDPATQNYRRMELECGQKRIVLDVTDELESMLDWQKSPCTPGDRLQFQAIWPPHKEPTSLYDSLIVSRTKLAPGEPLTIY